METLYRYATQMSRGYFIFFCGGVGNGAGAEGQTIYWLLSCLRGRRPTLLLPGAGKGFEAATWGGVEDGDFGGEGGNEFVAALGGFGGGTAGACREGRKQEEPALGERGAPGCRDAEAVEAAGGADDDGRFAGQQDCEALLFNRGIGWRRRGP